MSILPKGEHIRGEHRKLIGEHLSELYKQGNSIRQLARSTGRSYGFIRRILEDNEVELRPKGGRRKNGNCR